MQHPSEIYNALIEHNIFQHLLKGSLFLANFALTNLNKYLYKIETRCKTTSQSLHQLKNPAYELRIIFRMRTDSFSIHWKIYGVEFKIFKENWHAYKIKKYCLLLLSYINQNRLFQSLLEWHFVIDLCARPWTSIFTQKSRKGGG